jgi:hypothetical protein
MVDEQSSGMLSWRYLLYMPSGNLYLVALAGTDVSENIPPSFQGSLE